MSELRVTSCDGCDEMAPSGYNHLFPQWSGWLAVRGEDDDIDVCSWSCLATVVAARIAEEVSA